MVIEAVADAAIRLPDGQLALAPTLAMERLAAEMPGAWFQMRDRDGHVLRHGTVPVEFQAAAPRSTGWARRAWAGTWATRLRRAPG